MALQGAGVLNAFLRLPEGLLAFQGACATDRPPLRVSADQGAGVPRLPVVQGACESAPNRSGNFMCLRRMAPQSTPSLCS
eukprot:5542307-Pyramimonas_sp.AAC.1